ncbi:putative protease SohB [Escherichia coli]|nr:hypothetical protein [Escherichia coli]VCW49788.1 putative protease SohB [Escherichia coli]
MVCFGENRYRCAAIAAIAIIVNVAQRNKRQRGELRHLSEQYKDERTGCGADGLISKTVAQNAEEKAQARSESSKSESKLGEVATDGKPRVWVLDFKGSMDAHEVNSYVKR